MNQNDYRKIAEIMKLDNLDINRIKKANKEGRYNYSSEDLAFYNGMNIAIQNVRSQLIKLADYFEQAEEKKYETLYPLK